MYGGTFLAANRARASGLCLRCGFAEAKVNATGRQRCSSPNLTNKLYYDALYQSATPFVFVAPGRSVSMVLSADSERAKSLPMIC